MPLNIFAVRRSRRRYERDPTENKSEALPQYEAKPPRYLKLARSVCGIPHTPEGFGFIVCPRPDKESASGPLACRYGTELSHHHLAFRSLQACPGGSNELRAFVADRGKL